MTSKRAAESGWTLIELLIVISLIMILSSVALSAYSNTVTRAKETALMADLHDIREAIDQFYADKGHYPESLDALRPDYVRAMWRDPFTQRSDTWEVIPADRVDGMQSVAGVYNIKSGSTLTAIDGSRYSDW